MTITVFVPQQLRSYTSGKTSVTARGRTVDDALNTVDAQYPGFKFRFIDEQNRIREHMRVYVDGERIRSLDIGLKESSEIHIFGALSGG